MHLASTNKTARRPHRFTDMQEQVKGTALVVPSLSSENRDYLPVDLVPNGVIIGSKAFALYGAPLRLCP